MAECVAASVIWVETLDGRAAAKGVTVGVRAPDRQGERWRSSREDSAPGAARAIRGFRRGSTSPRTSRCSPRGRPLRSRRTEWTFAIRTETGSLTTWTWDEFMALPIEDVETDIHCVTRWSKLGTTWRGVSLDTLLDLVETDADYAMAHSYGGYTTNVPMEDLRDGKAWVAFEFDGEPLDRSTAGRRGSRAAPVLLEERQVGERPHAHGRRRARILGAERLQHARRPLAESGTGDRRRLARRPRVVEVSGGDADRACAARRGAGLAGQCPGQHVDIRLTAEDGYQAVRSYSMGSRRDGETVELAVDEIPEGEVSPYLVRDVLPGDELEVKGPLGGYFVWEPGGADPVQLIAGGSGIVPLMAMARARTDAATGVPFRLLYRCGWRRTRYIAMSSLTGDAGGVDVTLGLHRAAPDGWAGRVGRLDGEAARARGGRPVDRADRVRLRADRVRRACRRHAASSWVIDAAQDTGPNDSEVRDEG